MKKIVYLLILILLGFLVINPQVTLSQAEPQGRWVSYGNRYAVIVMGGPAEGQLERWYWEDTSGMYKLLKGLGFTDDNIYFLSWGQYASSQSIVDRPTTKENVKWAFEQVRAKSTANDLVYIFWVDHGDQQGFNLPPSGKSTGITHAELNDCIKNINAKIIIASFNPCYSGAVIDDISRKGVIVITSVNANQTNSFGWAGEWRNALSGGTSGNRTDKNGDGFISMTEAYEWVAVKSQAYNPPEYPLFDDNGDKMGGSYRTSGYDPNDPKNDGYIGSKYSLTGWFCEIQYGVAQYGDNQIIRFNPPFTETPVVITSAQINGKAISSCAVDLAKDNFLLYLTDDQGRAVPNAWVQWIAFVPSPTQEVIGGVLVASHGQHISFPRLSSTPVIVTNAQKDGKALISGAQNNAPDGFDLCLLDDSGKTVSGAWVLWMAVVPNSRNGFKGEVKMRSHWQNIQFSPPFAKGPAYVLSAQPGVMAGAVNNRQDGFILSLIKHDGTPANNIWTQWLGYTNP